MRTFLRSSVLALTLLGLIWLSESNTADAAAPSANVVVSEDFSASVPKGWRMAKGDWKIVDGAWRGAEIPADKHGAVARFPLEFTDAVIEFDFRLDGAKAISLSLNDKKEHVGRVSIRPNGFQVAKDDHDHDGPDERVVLANEKATFEAGKWYHARVEIAGPKLTAQIGDDKDAGKPVGGEHELIATKKANFGFTVAGQSASFRNLRVSVPGK